MDKLLKLKKIHILSLSFMCHYLGFGDIVQSEKLHQTTMTCQLILTLKAISCSVDYFLGVVNYLVGVVVFIACSMDSPNQFFCDFCEERVSFTRDYIREIYSGFVLPCPNIGY